MKHFGQPIFSKQNILISAVMLTIVVTAEILLHLFARPIYLTVARPCYFLLFYLMHWVVDLKMIRADLKKKKRERDMEHAQLVTMIEARRSLNATQSRSETSQHDN